MGETIPEAVLLGNGQARIANGYRNGWDLLGLKGEKKTRCCSNKKRAVIIYEENPWIPGENGPYKASTTLNKVIDKFNKNPWPEALAEYKKNVNRAKTAFETAIKKAALNESVAGDALRAAGSDEGK